MVGLTHANLITESHCLNPQTVKGKPIAWLKKHTVAANRVKVSERVKLFIAGLKY